tara:strand:- start:3431 stop:6016 length:2586 start_codon:yes stop_codon:yes gene_type:complete
MNYGKTIIGTTTTTFTNAPETILTASDAAINSNFGYTVAVSGNYAIVGAIGEDTGGTNRGAAYIFNVTTGNQLHKLTASDAGDNDYFGRVAIDGNYAVVGATSWDSGGTTSCGAVYVFDVTTGNQLYKLLASDRAQNDYLGEWVSISGNYVLAGAKGKASNTGAAYIFDVTTGNQVRKLTASDGTSNDYFGNSVAIDGNYAVVGAHWENSQDGAVYVFDVTTGNQLHKLTPSPRVAEQYFGDSVAISGNYIIIGASGDGNSNTGAAYIFDVTTQNELHKLTASDAAASDGFGRGVSISGNYAIVGSGGNDDVPNNSGSAYIFDVTTGNEIRKLTASDAAANDYFGDSVAISSNYIVIGAKNNDSQRGKAYMFTGTNNTPITRPLDASGTSVPALKSIYEQLMNVPGRSQIMETREVTNVPMPSGTNIPGGFPFISGDKLVMFLRPKIVFAAQTQAEQLNAIQAFNYTGSTILGTPAYNIADKNGPITGQTYSQSSSQDNTSFIFEKATTGAGVAGNEYFTSAGGTYNNSTGIHEGANANGTTSNIDVGTTPPAITTTHTVTVGDNGGNKFKIDGAFNPILTFVKGNTYIFDQSDATNSGHQIQISETSAGGNTSYATTVGTPGTAGAKTTVVVPTNAPGTLYYNCNPHGAGMGNSISVTSPSNSIDGEWGQVDIGESSWATELQLTTNNAYNDRSPREFRLLGSTDGANWKTLIHETEAGPWIDDTAQTFTISNPTSYRYYRYVVIKCYNAVNGGNIDARTSIGHFNLRGVKYPSEVVEVTNAGLMNGSPLDIPGLQTNVVASSANIQDAFPGNDTSGPEAEESKWGWMGSANSDTLSLDTTDIVNNRTIDLHIWKITITL